MFLLLSIHKKELKAAPQIALFTQVLSSIIHNGQKVEAICYGLVMASPPRIRTSEAWSVLHSVRGGRVFKRRGLVGGHWLIMLPSLVINLVLLGLWLVSNRWLLLEDWWSLPTLWLSVLQIWLLLITSYLHCEASFIKKPSHKWHSQGTIKKGHRISNLLLNKPHFLEGNYALHYPTNATTNLLSLHSSPTQLLI